MNNKHQVECVAHGDGLPPRRHREEDLVREEEAGLLGNLFYSSADAGSSLASNEDEDDDDDDDDEDVDARVVGDARMTDDGGTGGEFARGGSRDCDDGVSSARGEEDPSDSSEDGVDEFLEGILKRKDANEGEAEARDGGDGAALPPRGGGAGQARGSDYVPRQVGEGGRGMELAPQRIVPSHNWWGGAIAVPRLPPKYVDPDPVDYRRPAPYPGYQRPKSPTATEYYSGMQHRTNNKTAQHRPHQRDQQEKVFDLDEWEAARGAKRTDAMDRLQKKRNRSEGTHSKPHCKVRDSLDAKEKRANEVLAALESAKRYSAAASLASVAANAGSEEPADGARLPPAVARVGADAQEESRDTSKEVSLLLALAAPSSPDPVHHPDHDSHRTSYYDHEHASAPPEPTDDPETDVHHRFVGTGEFYSTARLQSEIISNSASDAWKTMDDIENASLSVSSSNESPDSVSSGNKRKDRSGHPKLNQVAVDYLRSWLLSRQHIEQPYPSEQNYADLSRATGLEKPQLKNWFV